jgi:hypothetical protein
MDEKYDALTNVADVKIGTVGRTKICTINKNSQEGKYVIAETQFDTFGTGKIKELPKLEFTGSDTVNTYEHLWQRLKVPGIEDMFQNGDELWLIECSTEGERPPDSICNTKPKLKLADVTISDVTSFYVGPASGINFVTLAGAAITPSFCICHLPRIHTADILLVPDSTPLPYNIVRESRKFNKPTSILSKAVKFEFRSIDAAG